MLRRVALVRTYFVLLRSVLRLLVTAKVVPISLSLFTLMMVAHGVTSQKTAFFIDTAVKNPQILHSIKGLDSVAET
jgi:hypothetical protein